MPSADASSARGGRSSAATTSWPDFSVSRNKFTTEWFPFGDSRFREYTIPARCDISRPRSALAALARRAVHRARALPDTRSRRRRACAPRSAAAPACSIKRDDAIAFGFGGNKVRKIEMVAASARAEGADLLITTGGVQSNHCRVTAAAAARLGMRCVIVANGTRARRGCLATRCSTRMFGAEVATWRRARNARPAMERGGRRIARAGRRAAFVIPLGASTPLGALGFVRASEMGEFDRAGSCRRACPTSSSTPLRPAGPKPGLVAGCAMHGLPTRVVGISADESGGRHPVDGLRDHRGHRGPAGRRWPGAGDGAAQSRRTTASSATATASRRRVARGAGAARARPKRWSWTTPTPPRRWPE